MSHPAHPSGRCTLDKNKQTGSSPWEQNSWSVTLLHLSQELNYSWIFTLLFRKSATVKQLLCTRANECLKFYAILGSTAGVEGSHHQQGVHLLNGDNYHRMQYKLTACQILTKQTWPNPLCWRVIQRWTDDMVINEESEVHWSSHQTTNISASRLQDIIAQEAFHWSDGIHNSTTSIHPRDYRDLPQNHQSR